MKKTLMAATSAENINTKKWTELIHKRENSKLKRFAESSDIGGNILLHISSPFDENEINTSINSLKMRKAVWSDKMMAWQHQNLFVPLTYPMEYINAICKSQN